MEGDEEEKGKGEIKELDIGRMRWELTTARRKEGRNGKKEEGQTEEAGE